MLAFRALCSFALLVSAHALRRSSNRVGAQEEGECGVKGASGPSSRIVNGEEATECEWPWQAQLTRLTGTFCGGTLVAPQWVLTAAHCSPLGLPVFDVNLGNWNTSRFSSSRNVQKRKAAKLYKQPGTDFMMVKLDRPVEMTDCVGVACLPAPGADVPPNSKCWITGWGNLKSPIGGGPKILQEAEVTVLSNEDCVNKFSYTADQIDDGHLCAQGQTSDGEISGACRGDSGGPLVCEASGQWTVYGATSFGLGGCASQDYPGVWSRVSTSLGWIQGLIAGSDTE